MTIMVSIQQLQEISCGYLPLLKQYSLTLSINYSVTQPCPYNTPINSVHPRLAEPRSKATAPLAGTLDQSDSGILWQSPQVPRLELDLIR